MPLLLPKQLYWLYVYKLASNGNIMGLWRQLTPCRVQNSETTYKERLHGKGTACEPINNDVQTKYQPVVDSDTWCWSYNPGAAIVHYKHLKTTVTPLTLRLLQLLLM